MLNYNTKFAHGDTVKIVKGFFLGKVGKIVDYFPGTAKGLQEDNEARGLDSTGIYTVKLGWMKEI